MNLVKRFNTYQKERFPLAILATTTFSVALSSAAVTLQPTNVPAIIFACIAGVAYLFHIRVIDEVRDHAHDAVHHQSRPIHRGVISLKELRTIDTFSVVIFLIIALFFGKMSVIIAIACLTYTYIASKEFFLGEKIRSRFFVYNAVNLAQMILLQLFIYSLFFEIGNMGSQMWVHLIFILGNSVLLEILRKIKISSEESVGRDTYSWHIGFSRSLQIFSIVACIDFMVFIKLVFFKISPLLIMTSTGLMLLLLSSIFLHSRTKAKRSENYLYLAVLVLYVGLNIIIYFTL